jgi:hypothetical protein
MASPDAGGGLLQSVDVPNSDVYSDQLTYWEARVIEQRGGGLNLGSEIMAEKLADHLAISYGSDPDKVHARSTE